ncbi:hypothetical protein [Aestuariispira insulae]|uniref:Uncharacterized protein n=1 Tax=Aestuariispira insulae TaxID=1461337 RepID=A0A3D9HVQ6_9PROT|nr:hypothetical protein [Aestuariispira insulae]RED53547.1 hypothetical protein DFP90_101338 [Aestuariispira insulae]
MNSSHKKHFRQAVLCGAALAIFIGFGSPAITFADVPNWSPKASERLVKLPGNYLKKAIDRDFAGSELAGAINDIGSQVNLKKQSIKDLEEAAEMADGDVRIELRHQHLAEKQEFIKLMGERQDLQRKQVQTRITLYKRLLNKLQRENRGTDPETQQLVQQQEEARQRFETVADQLDLELFGEPGVKQSKYSVEYAKNYAAIQQLSAAINSHPMNQQPEMNGEPISKQDYLRQLIQTAESEKALLDQQDSILGYMAKLVALDALALAEDVQDEQLGFDPDDEEQEDPLAVANNVDLFLN